MTGQIGKIDGHDEIKLGSQAFKMAAKMAEYMGGAKRGDILPPYTRISQLDGKGTAQNRYLGSLTCEEMQFRKLFLERSSPLNSALGFFKSVLQIGTFETLTGSRTVCPSHRHMAGEVCLFQCEFMVKKEIMVLACQVSVFHLTLTQINAEMNCIAKNKCTDESQNLDMRCRDLNTTSHVSRATTYIFLHSVFALFYVIQEKHQTI